MYSQSKSDKLFSDAHSSLDLAVEFQKKMIEELRARSLKVEGARKVLAEINFKLLSLHSSVAKESTAILHYLEEAIKNDPENTSYHLLHGEIYWRMNDLEIAKKAKQVLKGDFRHSQAVTLFADCLLQGGQFEMGQKGFSKIFEKDKQVNNSFALMPVLFWFYRNAGRLEDFKALIDEHQKPRNGVGVEFNDSAISFAIGLYNYAIRSQNAAIESLIKARQSPELIGPVSLILIDIYLHDSSYNIYSNFFNRDKFKSLSKQHLKTIRGLIEDLPEADYASLKPVYRIVVDALEDNVKMASSLKVLEELLENPTFKIYQSMILYYAVIFQLKLKSKDNLKEMLVKIRNLEYKPHRCFDEYYFRSLLLCCDTLIFKDKLKPAKSLIDTTLTYNRGCLPAYEYLLVYHEKNKESTTEILRTAFAITSSQDPNLGYRYAKNLMNEGQFVESFKVCKTVLAKYPKFKSIETDVLIKVREELINNY